MAWIFSLWVETETDSEKKAILRYFDGRIINIGEKTYTILAYKNGMLSVEGISKMGINSQSDADEMTAIGFQFYDLLKNAPPFAYALVGVEVDESVLMEELCEDPGFFLKIKGFVINEKLYQKINAGQYLLPFAMGYLWNPYEGEQNG